MPGSIQFGPGVSRTRDCGHGHGHGLLAVAPVARLDSRPTPLRAICCGVGVEFHRQIALWRE